MINVIENPTKINYKFQQYALHFFYYLLCFCLSTTCLTSCSSSRTIVNGLDEREANEILVFLATHGISASKIPSSEGGGSGASKLVLWDIQVNDAQATEAMSLLNQAGLPRRKSQSLLHIFTGGALVPSELQEKIRYQAGLGEQIASIIRKIDGVLDAEVQISFPEENPLNPSEKKDKITASVYVKHSGVLDDPNTHLVTKIKRLVAAGVPGLDFDNVTVVGDRARYTSVPAGGQALSEEERQYVRIWTIVLAKESVTRFQILFFSFIIFLLLLVLSLVWLSWKFYPVLSQSGGFKELFHIKPISLEREKQEEQESEEKVEEKEEPTQKQEGKIEKDIDET